MTLPVLIVGAGPSGLVSTLSLAQSGIQVRIIDKSDSFHVGSRGFGVQPRTFELFQHLGIIDDIQKLATPIPTMCAYELPGGTVPVTTWDLYEKSGVRPDRPYVNHFEEHLGIILDPLQANGACVSQDLLEGVLRGHLAKHGVSVELNKGLAAIKQDATTVTATFAVFRNGVPTEEKEEVVAQHLIGSDGAKGTERSFILRTPLTTLYAQATLGNC